MSNPPHPASHETAPITAVLLAYEQAPVVEAAIRSIFNQTLQPAEIILSDDGSKDGTHAVMEKLAAIYQGPAGIRVRQSTGGAGLLAHINACVKLASQPWILVFAGDDVSKPQRVARFAEEIRNRPEARLMRADGSLTGQTMGITSYQAGRLRGVGASQCWHRGLFSEFGDLPEVQAAEDIILPFRAHLLGGLRFIPEPLVEWRDRDYRQLDRLKLDTTYEVRATVFRVNAARALIADLETFENRHPERAGGLSNLRRRLSHTLDAATAEHEVVSIHGRAARAAAILLRLRRLGLKRARRLWQDQVLRLPAYLDSAYPRAISRWLPRSAGLAAAVALGMQQAGPPAWLIALAAGLLVMEACRMGMRLAAAKLWPPA
ncbi:MAG: glycosyltransferase family 2 protein [Akkermansiaceae bacterium]|nr:glycosyltransferase family 2 protein [Akkermansiaceae bacterium]